MTRLPNPKSTGGFNIKARNEAERKIIADLKQLAIQDGVEISDLVFEGILFMFKAHHWPPGNPQLQLSGFLVGREVQSKRPEKCGFKGCGGHAVAMGRYVPKNQTLGLCRLHFGLVQGKERLWSDVKLTEAVSN
jgi:hypothetical protein